MYRKYHCWGRAVGQYRRVCWIILHDQYWVTNHGIFTHSRVGSEMSHHLLYGSLGLWPPPSLRSLLGTLGYSLANFYERNQKLFEWLRNRIQPDFPIPSSSETSWWWWRMDRHMQGTQNSGLGGRDDYEAYCWWSSTHNERVIRKTSRA